MTRVPFRAVQLPAGLVGDASHVRSASCERKSMLGGHARTQPDITSLAKRQRFSRDEPARGTCAYGDCAVTGFREWSHVKGRKDEEDQEFGRKERSWQAPATLGPP
ncbi:uncharacterized protein CC84DRAFT_1159180 [Paraphaeosphaeria sporulosa]|uniref:Uncharacterized protein n=1 Tax=Paraphaeosphaeria sporulosa TaxID=1460663 RepID=A0A177CWX5_9PLEO|nr:uncharacterized protein CC84DRAFT_1159180 [Paraphaeosphaeria sporulosa]OAG11716.1 hypothetical protein CC84DRAFT_1159180 [Paraphaeosphaeria sporulosa]